MAANDAKKRSRRRRRKKQGPHFGRSSLGKEKKWRKDQTKTTTVANDANQTQPLPSARGLYGRIIIEWLVDWRRLTKKNIADDIFYSNEVEGCLLAKLEKVYFLELSVVGINL